MRIVLLCHYFHPEPGAPSARMLSLAREFKALGHEVTVVTGFPNHPSGVIPEHYRGRVKAVEEYDGIRVLRNWLYATPNEGIVKKSLGHLSFMLTSVVFAGPRLGPVDVIVVSSPTFFSVISAWFLGVVKRVPFVFEVRDLWPAIFVELGVLKNRAVIRLLEALEMFLYRRSAAVVAVTDSFRDTLVRRGLSAAKVHFIPNGVDLGEFSPGPADDGLCAELGLQGKTVVLYLGTHGISHALEAVVAAAKMLEKRDDICFLFVGAGARKPAVEAEAERLGLRNVRFLPAQPRDGVLRFYRSADICLVPLRDIPLFDTFIPSKMFEMMGCAKPIVASVRGEAARILESSGGALVVGPEDSRGIAEAVERLSDDAGMRGRMGAAGRAYAGAHYQRRDLARRYAAILEAVTAKRR